MLEIGSAKRLRGLDWKQLGVGGGVRVEVHVLLLLFFTQIVLAGCKWGPEWRSDAELQLLRQWLQPPRRQIWIKSHWEIPPCLLCKLRRHAGTAAISRRMTTVVSSSGLLQRLVLSDSAHPTGGRVRGRGERVSSSPPPFLSAAEYFCTRGFSKACFLSSAARRKQLGAKEIRG